MRQSAARLAGAFLDAVILRRVVDAFAAYGAAWLHSAFSASALRLNSSAPWPSAAGHFFAVAFGERL